MKRSSTSRLSEGLPSEKTRKTKSLSPTNFVNNPPQFTQPSPTCTSQQINITCPPCVGSSCSTPCYVPRTLNTNELRNLFGNCMAGDFYILYVGAHGNHVSHDPNVFKSIRIPPINIEDKRVSIVKLGVAGHVTQSRGPGLGTNFKATNLLMDNCFVVTPRNNTMAEVKLTPDSSNGIGNISLIKVVGDTYEEIPIYNNRDWNADKRPLYLSDIYEMFNNLLLKKEGDEIINGILYLTACEPRDVSKGRITADIPASEREAKNMEEMKTPRGTPKTDPNPLSRIEKAKISLVRSATGPFKNAARAIVNRSETDRVFRANIDPEILINSEILEKINTNMEKAFDDLNIQVGVSQPIQSAVVRSLQSPHVSPHVSPVGSPYTKGGFIDIDYSKKSRKSRKSHKSRKKRKTYKGNKIYL